MVGAAGDVMARLDGLAGCVDGLWWSIVLGLLRRWLPQGLHPQQRAQQLNQQCGQRGHGQRDRSGVAAGDSLQRDGYGVCTGGGAALVGGCGGCGDLRLQVLGALGFSLFGLQGSESAGGLGVRDLPGGAAIWACGDVAAAQRELCAGSCGAGGCDVGRDDGQRPGLCAGGLPLDGGSGLAGLHLLCASLAGAVCGAGQVGGVPVQRGQDAQAPQRPGRRADLPGAVARQGWQQVRGQRDQACRGHQQHPVCQRGAALCCAGRCEDDAQACAGHGGRQDDPAHAVDSSAAALSTISTSRESRCADMAAALAWSRWIDQPNRASHTHQA